MHEAWDDLSLCREEFYDEHTSSAERGSTHTLSRTGDRGSPSGGLPAEGAGSRTGTGCRDLESQTAWATLHLPDPARRQTNHQDVGRLAGHYHAGRSARTAGAAMPLTRELFTRGVEQRAPLPP